MILVISYPGDLHARRVIGILKNRAYDVELLNYADFPRKVEISFLSKEEKTDCFIKLPSGRKIEASKVSSVWCRRPKPPRLRTKVDSGKIRKYIVRESTEVLDSLMELTTAFWLCHPDKVRIAAHKGYQLNIARCLGFNVPDTLITNSAEEVRSFLSGRSNVAVKTLFSPGIEITVDHLKTPIALYTKRVPSAEVLDGIDHVKNCPFILQDYVEKEFELRITVVGKKVFACRVDTQRSEKTREDFRFYDLENTPHSKFQLPPDIESKCVALTLELGLNFGCIDMIVDHGKTYHFLEINPNGQWLWTEDLAGLPISEAVADLLSGNA